MPGLPERPSIEHLRKQAKRYSRERSIALAQAQHQLANEYGHRSWTHLLRYVAGETVDLGAAPLFRAVRSGDVEAVRLLIGQGGNPQLGDGRESLLHAAARRGPLAVVEALIEAGAVDWQTDAAGRTPLDVARRCRARDRRAIVGLLDRNADADASFRAAIRSIQHGDAGALARQLDAEPRLLRERILGPEAYRKSARPGYFRDPKLFWYIANNPKLVDRMPRNMPEIASVMIDRGVDRADLDYALGLVMTSSAARAEGLQRDLVVRLRAAGAVPTRETLVSTAAHRELAILRLLVDDGEPMSALLAGALGDAVGLSACIANADAEEIRVAFALAAINEQLDCVRIALDAGADVNAFFPDNAHGHSTALHQAATNDDALLIDLLLARGARLDLSDKLWGGTALDWAIHEGRPAARAALERAARSVRASSISRRASKPEAI